MELFVERETKVTSVLHITSTLFVLYLLRFFYNSFSFPGSLCYFTGNILYFQQSDVFRMNKTFRKIDYKIGIPDLLYVP